MNHETERPDGPGFEVRAKAVFDASVARMDGATRSRLNQARQQALAAAQRPGFRLPRFWVPAGAFATAAVLSVAVFVAVPALRGHHGVDATAVEEVDVLAANDNLDLYAEDPEFFEWAGKEPAGAGEQGAAAADQG